MTISPEILDSLEKREEELQLIKRCVNVNICPRCGHDLANLVDDIVCPKCRFSSNAANFFKRMYDPSEVRSR